MSGSVDMGFEGNAFLSNLGERVETENLKPSTIGKDRFIPVHKPVEPTKRLDN